MACGKCKESGLEKGIIENLKDINNFRIVNFWAKIITYVGIGTTFYGIIANSKDDKDLALGGIALFFTGILAEFYSSRKSKEAARRIEREYGHKNTSFVGFG